MSGVKTMTASQAARNFTGLLDAMEHREAIMITRGGVAAAEGRVRLTTDAPADFAELTRVNADLLSVE